jgi:hypothetical protein
LRKDYLPLSSEKPSTTASPMALNESVNDQLIAKRGEAIDDQRIKCYQYELFSIIKTYRQQTKYFTIISSIASFGYLILALVGIFGLENSQ